MYYMYYMLNTKSIRFTQTKQPCSDLNHWPFISAAGLVQCSMRRKGTSDWWTSLWRFLSSVAESCIKQQMSDFSLVILSRCLTTWLMLMLHKAGNVRFSLWHWWMATAPAPRFHQSSGGVKTCFWIHHPCIISPWTMGQSGFYGLGNVLKMEFVYVYNLFCHLIRFLTVMKIKINVTRKLILWASFTVSFNCVCFDTFLQHRCSMYNILSVSCMFQFLWTTSWPLWSAWCRGSCSRSSAPCACSSSAASPTPWPGSSPPSPPSTPPSTCPGQH